MVTDFGVCSIRVHEIGYVLGVETESFDFILQLRCRARSVTVAEVIGGSSW